MGTTKYHSLSSFYLQEPRKSMKSDDNISIIILIFFFLTGCAKLSSDNCALLTYYLRISYTICTCENEFISVGRNSRNCSFNRIKIYCGLLASGSFRNFMRWIFPPHNVFLTMLTTPLPLNCVFHLFYVIPSIFLLSSAFRPRAVFIASIKHMRLPKCRQFPRQRRGLFFLVPNYNSVLIIRNIIQAPFFNGVYFCPFYHISLENNKYSYEYFPQ